MHSFDEEKFLSRSYGAHPIRSSRLSDAEIEYLRNRYSSRFPELVGSEHEPRMYCQLLWAELKWELTNITPYCSVCGGLISPDRLKTRILDLRRGYSGTRTCGETYCTYELVARTSEERYGARNVSSLEEIKQKKAQTTLKNYGVDNPLKSDTVREISKQTMIRKYGVDHWNKSEKLKKESRERYFKETGYYHHLSNPEVIKTREETLMKNHGVSNVFQLDEVKAKLRETNLEKYGYANPFSSPEIQKKIIETNLKNLGCMYPTQNREVMGKAMKSRKESGNRVTSSLEDLFLDKFLSKYDIQYIVGEVDLVPSNEYDLYIPSKKLVIDLNGEYFHSLGRKTEDYHFNRTNELASIGIKCIYFWDFEIYSDKETEYIVDILDFHINSKINSSIRNLLDSSEDLDRDKFSELDFPTYSVLKSEPEIRNQGSTQERIIVRSGILRRNK